MDFHKNILIFPGGTESGLEIWKALKGNKFFTLYSASSNVSNHAPYVFSNHYVIPSVFQEGWIDTLNDITDRMGIDYIYPAHDDVLLSLADNIGKIKARIVMPSVNAVRICRSKLLTYNFFNSILPTPKIYKDPSEVDRFPVFVKPDIGQGSFNAYLIKDKVTLELILRKIPGMVVLEYLEGKEYTVDCFSDREKGLMFCGARERIRTRNGISVDTKPAPEEVTREVKQYAIIISEKLNLNGAWFFQVKQDSSGDYKLLEVGTRIAGGMALFRVTGINFPLLSILEQERIPVEIFQNKFDVELDRSLVNHYKTNIRYDNVYIDLDDCLFVNNKLNYDLLKFLFQCKGNKIKLNLITRNNTPLDKLRSMGLPELFDKVIHIGLSDKKSDYIEGSSSIFIDDSFAERLEVSKTLGIPVFEPSAVEVLLDERE